jgi:hypothetical protein
MIFTSPVSRSSTALLRCLHADCIISSWHLPLPACHFISNTFHCAGTPVWWRESAKMMVRCVCVCLHSRGFPVSTFHLSLLNYPEKMPSQVTAPGGGWETQREERSYPSQVQPKFVNFTQSSSLRAKMIIVIFFFSGSTGVWPQGFNAS